MKKNVALVCSLIFCIPVVYGQSKDEEIQKLQQLVKANEERAKIAEQAARIAEADAKNKRYVAAALEIAFNSEEVSDKELAALLALQAYHFNAEHGGYEFDSRIYNSLFKVLKRYDRFPQRLSQAKDLKTNDSQNTFPASMPNGRAKVIAEQNGDLKLAYVEDGVTIRILSGHKAQVDRIAFSSKSLMATSDKNKTIRIWNLNQLNQRPIVIVENANIIMLSFSADGSTILYVTADNTNVIKSLPMYMPKMAEEICQLVTRNLNKDEWDFYVGSDLDYESTCSTFRPNNK